MDSKEFFIPRLGEAQIASPVQAMEFVPDDATVAYDTSTAVLEEYVKNGQAIPAFEQAGPRKLIYHDPAWSKAAILTAGGLCPGLNE